jgi:hypothetical protein
MIPDGIRKFNALTTNSENLTRLESGLTEKNNAFGIFKDNNGNSIYRVDYKNNDTNNIYDEEEVRSSDGKLISYTERSYTDANMYFKKYYYDANENLIKITETKCDSNGNAISTKELPVDDEPELKGYVLFGTPVDGDGRDKSLIEKFRQWGATMIGNQ